MNFALSQGTIFKRYLKMNQEKTVILAEPVGALSSSLHDFLVEKGYHFIKASTLKETLLTLQKQRVDALVLDVSLMENDFGFIPVIRGIEDDLPIIICAETNTPELESKIRQQKIFYYHIKSFGIQDLEMAISNAINGLSH